MKKIFICILLVTCLLGVTACSAPDTSVHSTWLTEDDPYLSETLVYQVTPELGTGTGVGEYVMTARRITGNHNATVIDSIVTLNTVNKDTKTVAPATGTTRQNVINELATNGGYVLTTSLTYSGEHGVDVMESELILSSTYHPIALYKKLSFAAEDQADYDVANGFASYEYSADYSYNSSSVLQAYNATVLMRTGKTEYTAFSTMTNQFDSTNVWDANQVVYLMRSLDVSQSSFTYSYVEPAPLDTGLSLGTGSTPMKQIGLSVASDLGFVTPIFNGGTEVSCRVVSMNLANLAVQGMSATVYLASNQTDATFNSANVKLTSLPVKIVQGGYEFLLKSISLA